MTFTVESAVDAHIRNTEKPRPPDGLWHPSSLFSCERQAVYEVRGTPASDIRENRSRRILRLGTTVHEIVQDALAHEVPGANVYNEVAVDIPALGITGHCDTLIEFPAVLGGHEYVRAGGDGPSEWELLEFKSIGSKGLPYLKGPKPEHESQARTYAYGLRHIGGAIHDERCGDIGPHPWLDCIDIPPLGDKLRRIRIAYFSRDDLAIEEFVLEVDEAWEADLEAKIARLDRYRADGEALPPRLPLENGKRNWLCAGYCQFRTRCWNRDPEGEVL